MQPLSGRSHLQVSQLFFQGILSFFVAPALIDTKNCSHASEELKAAAIGMFCNGDIEERFNQGIQVKGRPLGAVDVSLQLQAARR